MTEHKTRGPIEGQPVPLAAVPSVLRMSLADIARAARVERPVVSMWRKRTNRAGAAFPQPVGERAGHPEFDAREVSDFLRSSGLGNNPEAADEIVRFARPSGALAETVSPALATALLAVVARSAELIADLDDDDLADSAAYLDPDDHCIKREIEAALPVSPELASYVDSLADAAYSARAAIDVVAAEAARLSGGSHRRTVLGGEAPRLVAGLAIAIARAIGEEGMRFVDPTPGDGRLLAALADAVAEESADFAVVGDGTEISRMARRVLLARDVSPELLPIVDGELDLGGPAVIVGALPTASDPAMSVEAMLDAVNDVTLAMSPRHWGILLAPSTVLTDKLSDQLVGLRDNVIRDGRLRMAVRLPAGLAIHQGQTHLALWVFGPPTRDVAPDQRATVVADLSDVELTDAVIDELTTDAVTSLSSVQLAVRAHAFNRSSIVPTKRLLLDSGSLVADATPTTYAPSEGTAERIERLRLVAGRAGEGWGAYASPTAPSETVPTVTVGRALRSKWIRVLGGHRISDTDIAEQETGAPVIGPDEIAGRSLWGSRRIDLLELAARYPHSRLTEPGDVVFATVGEVVATVDRYGGAVVTSPARILRVRGGPPGGVLVPEVLAADLRRQPASARRFESWPVRVVPDHVAPNLQERAAALASAEADLREQLANLQALQTALIDGVTSGRAHLADSDTHPNNQSDQPHSADKETPK